MTDDDFAALADGVRGAARAHGFHSPTFTHPPSTEGCDRTIAGDVAGIRVEGRRPEAVVKDMAVAVVLYHKLGFPMPHRAVVTGGSSGDQEREDVFVAQMEVAGLYTLDVHRRAQRKRR